MIMFFMTILGLQALLCSLEWVLTRRLPMQSGIGANKQQMRPAKPEIFHKNMLLMALLLLIVMISMTEILVAMENLQRSRTLQQSKQRSRSDFKYIGIDWAVVIITFHDDVNFVFTSEVISLVTVLPQLAHTVVTGSLSKTTLAIAEHYHAQIQHQTLTRILQRAKEQVTVHGREPASTLQLLIHSSWSPRTW